MYCLVFCTAQPILKAIDTVETVTVNALYSNVKWKETPAAIALLNGASLSKFSDQSFLSAMNTVSGVRMEERSPGSYRFSIRGSLLRSPFGVRNIKIYWNGLPLSDAGGNTYLNLMEVQNISTAEIIKGPTASVYGAGTGGALLLQSALAFTNTKKNQFNIGLTKGSYGLFSENMQWKFSSKNSTMQLLQSHQQNNGYREQSALNKNVLQYNAGYKNKHHLFEISAFYTSLNYQTPGGITYEQMLLNPILARQATTTLPSAKQQQTAVDNQTFFGGINHTLSLTKQIQLNTALALSTTNFKNLFITNFEKRKEKNTSVTSKLIVKKAFEAINIKWITGFEYLVNNSNIYNFGNKNGYIDTLQFQDEVKANQWFIFSQMNMSYKKLNVQFGLSVNEQWYAFKRLSDVNFINFKEATTNIIATPRLAASYQLNKDVSVYGLAAKGFSAPTLAEIKPSDGNFYSNLKAEFGWNFEIGIKGNLLKNKLQFDVALYHFTLNNAIVRRNNLVGAEYFVNAGSTLQKGIEATLNYVVFSNDHNFFTSLKLSSSNSFQPYKFTNYIVGINNFSNNALTGVPKINTVSTLDVTIKNKFSIFVILNYTDKIPLTDANDAFANNYRLLQIKMNYFFKIQNAKLNLFFAIDNALNELYSLGNDINAAGKRFYNPAPARNFLTGINIRFN